MRARDQQRRERTPGIEAADGSQWRAGQWRSGREWSFKHSGSWNQHRAAGDGLWRCRSHPGVQAHGRRLGTIRAVETPSARFGRMRSEARSPRLGGQSLYRGHGNPEVPQKFREARQKLRLQWVERQGCEQKLDCRGCAHNAALTSVPYYYRGVLPQSAMARRLRTAPAASTAPSIPEKSIAVLPFENLSSDQGKRLLCRWHPGRNSDALSEDRRSEGDLAHIHAALQKRAGESARDRKATWGRPHLGRKRAKSRQRGAHQRAVNQSCNRCAPLGREL